MALHRCPRCSELHFLEDLTCSKCGTALGFHPPSLTWLALDDAVVNDVHWYPCANRDWLCPWLVSEHDESARCFSCRLTRRRPASDDTIAMEKLRTAWQAQRRLLFQLRRLNLPVSPWYEGDGGLGFDLLSSYSVANERITIGHSNGIVQIDLVETLDSYRERLRVALAEPYRTMLGHYRHEVGHYYQWVLVEQTSLIDRCREIFGDERASYPDAIKRHYRSGAPDGWETSYISEYATMHPWEDFAESFAHYLHITAVLETATLAGLTLEVPSDGMLDMDHTVEPQETYPRSAFDQLMYDWTWTSTLFNRANRSMGKADLYPFSLPPAVRTKLEFVHDVVTTVPDYRSSVSDGFRRLVL